MQGANFTGRSMLIVEDEPVIALHIGAAFERAGAIIVKDTDALCGRLKQRAMPFVLHSGYSHLSDACHGGIVVPKPASPEVLIEALLGALR